jgi:hypothetical protein
MSKISAVILCAGVVCLSSAMPASAQVRDAVYRGTLICSALPFLKGHLRAAMEVTIKDNKAEYKQPVINAEKGTQLGMEAGSGTVEGQNIKLSGTYRGQSSFDATYSGTFVRRAARLNGTQTWTHEGKTYKRTCSGAVKRPLAMFLKRDKAN